MSVPLRHRASEADDVLSSTKIHSVTAASTPVSPGPATPTSFRTPSFPSKISDDVITPPARPKSTPFPQQDELEDEAISLRLEESHRHAISTMDSHTAECSPSSKLMLTDLPTEISEIILDCLLGTRASTSSKTLMPGSSAALRGWGTALRHSRRRERTDLALVSSKWRVLVQERLYRHIKIKGTKAQLQESASWFWENRHLQQYVKHIEIWIPVWEKRAGGLTDQYLASANASQERMALARAMNDQGIDSTGVVGSAYQLSSGNASLEAIFAFVTQGLSEACILTLEGGHGCNPPRVRHFAKPGIEDERVSHKGPASMPDEDESYLVRRLPTLKDIRCLVLKGAWNIMRSEFDLRRILNAAPNLEEFHCTYQEANSPAYLTIGRGFPLMPTQIRHVNLLLEGNYTHELMSPILWRNIYPEKLHICHELAKITPHMEHFQYTGRVCYQFFDQAVRLADPDDRGNMRLKSLDLTVKNTCRSLQGWPDGSGINDWPFIQSFERLVAAGIRSLSRFKAVRYLRIRFIDLDSPLPLMNPYFLMKDGKCSGIWSEKLVELLAQHRPAASYHSLQEDSPLPPIENRETPYSRHRPVSIKVSLYKTLADPMFHHL